MVVYFVFGGLLSLVGAVYGTLLVNAGKTIFSESFPDLWLFLMAALFIGVTMAFPMGLAGLWEERIKPYFQRLKAEKKINAERVAAAQAAYPNALPARGSEAKDTAAAQISTQNV